MSPAIHVLLINPLITDDECIIHGSGKDSEKWGRTGLVMIQVLHCLAD